MPARLFAGEAVEASNGPAVLVKYVPGDPKRPLVVLIPGGFHLGRVFYGGHAGQSFELEADVWRISGSTGSQVAILRTSSCIGYPNSAMAV